MVTMKLNNRMARLLCATVLAGSVAAPAFAQEEASVAEAETIIVTGSRIARNAISATPVQVVTAVDIQESGVTNIQELLLDNPAFGTPAIGRTNSNFATASAGVSTIDLRNLGNARTLVLVDGRRTVSGVPGDSAVDLNTIPTAFIERVDVLTGGASSLYGSDAVAGVVNFVYRKNFEGVEMNAQLGISEHGDDLRRSLNTTFGTNFADGRGNVMVHMGYTNDGAVYSRDRARSAIDQQSLLYATGNPEDTFIAQRPVYSSYAPQGRFFKRMQVQGRDADGNLAFNDDGTPTMVWTNATLGTFDKNNNFITGFDNNGDNREADGYNRSADRSIAIPTERYLMAMRANYEISDNVEAFIDGTFAATKTKTKLEAYPLDSYDLSPATNGFFNAENYQLDANGLPTGTIVANPFIPDALLNLMTDHDGDGLRDYAFTRRLGDVANRGNEAERYTFRIVTGLKGEVFDGWNWDAYYSYGQTSENQTATGQFNVVNFRNALQITRDANGDLICMDPNAREEGCVPVNVFGRNTMTPEMLSYINAPSMLSTLTRQQLAGANLSGELVDLWGAGAIGLAVGAEYRKEYARSSFDALQQAGLNGGNAIPNTEGSFDVKEAYGELRIPLLTGVPFFQNLVLTGAARVADYSTVGQTFSWNITGEWEPVEGLRFRATRAQATRAPNINELFSPPSQTFPTGLIDPCDGVTMTDSSPLAQNCRAATGVMDNMAANGGVFTLTTADQQGITGFDGGNPDLKEETSKSWTLGGTLNLRQIDALRGFTLAVDYYDIQISDAIVSTPRQYILDKCYGEGNTALCEFITRRASPEGAQSAGSLDEIDSGVTNSGGLGTTGIDVVLNWAGRGLGGNLAASIAYNHVFTAWSEPLVGEGKDNFNGEIGAPQDRFSATASWSNQDFGLTLRGTYIGASYLDDQFLTSNGLEARGKDYRVDPYFYMDMQFRITPMEKFEFYGGIDNLLNTGVAPVITGLPGNDTGTETHAGLYDPLGRRFYVGARLKF